MPPPPPPPPPPPQKKPWMRTSSLKMSDLFTPNTVDLYGQKHCTMSRILIMITFFAALNLLNMIISKISPLTIYPENV